MFSCNPTAFSRKLKIAPTTLPVMASNASTAFLASILSPSANLSGTFPYLQSLLIFRWRASCPLPPPKSPMTESTIAAIPTKRAVNVKIIVTTCSRIKVRILSGKGVFLSRTYSMVCLILVTCV